MKWLVVIVAVALGSWSGYSLADTPRVPQSQDEVRLSFAPLVKRTAPAVVNIYTTKTVRARPFSPLFDDPFFRRFFGDALGGLPGPGQGQQRRVQNSLGSGVIVDAGGVVVTNNHVIEGADDIKVVLSDRREFDATLVGTDERTDLAVLRIDTGGEALPHLAMRDSDDLEVGDLVLAVGNPFGVGQTVTSGIVSAVARTQVGISDLNFFIQTDAAINPGNSGGALVSMDGKLVGINTAIYSRTGTSIGIGFAIPANMVRSVVTGVSDGGRIVRPWLGVAGQGVSADIAANLGLKRPAGVLISDVYRGGPADAAGLRPGDVVMTIDGRAVDDPEALRFRFATVELGRTVELGVWRGGATVTLTVAALAPPETPPREVTEVTGRHPLSGSRVANLSPALADELGFDAMAKGVVIVEVRPGGTAQRLGFMPGDILLALNGTAVASVAEFKRLINARAESWTIRIERGGRQLERSFRS